MAGNLSAFQLGPGAIVQLETNQGPVLAVVLDADSQAFSPPEVLGLSGGLNNWNISGNSNLQITLTGNATIVIMGLVPGRSQWLQFTVIQGSSTPRSLTILYAPFPYQPAKTPSGAGLTFSTSPAPGAVDIVSLYWDGQYLYAMMAGLNFA